jgi:hypothetical protein
MAAFSKNLRRDRCFSVAVGREGGGELASKGPREEAKYRGVSIPTRGAGVNGHRHRYDVIFNELLDISEFVVKIGTVVALFGKVTTC